MQTRSDDPLATMRTRWTIAVFAIVGITLTLCVPAAFAGSASAPTAVPQSGVFMQPRHAGDPVECNDAYFEYLPGLLNFCLGVRAWDKGRYASAIDWLKLAAGWGSKGSQYMLGLMYFNGDHVGPDRALGLAWLRLANERHNNQQIALVARSTEALATTADRQQANELFDAMSKRYADKVAALRAWTQFRHHSELVDYQLSGALGGSGASGCVFLPPGQAGAMGPPLQPLEAPLPSPHQPPTSPRPVQNRACVSPEALRSAAVQLANHYFDGWSGHVTVGPLQPLRAKPKSPD